VQPSDGTRQLVRGNTHLYIAGATWKVKRIRLGRRAKLGPFPSLGLVAVDSPKVRSTAWWLGASEQSSRSSDDPQVVISARLGQRTARNSWHRSSPRSSCTSSPAQPDRNEPSRMGQSTSGQMREEPRDRQPRKLPTCPKYGPLLGRGAGAEHDDHRSTSHFRMSESGRLMRRPRNV
jgi:hypothetical protein